MQFGRLYLLFSVNFSCLFIFVIRIDRMRLLWKFDALCVVKANVWIVPKGMIYIIILPILRTFRKTINYPQFRIWFIWLSMALKSDWLTTIFWLAFSILSYFKLQFRDETQTKSRDRDRGERTKKKYQFKVNDNKYFHRMSAETGGHWMSN